MIAIESPQQREVIGPATVIMRCGSLRLTALQGFLLVIIVAAALRFCCLGTRSLHGDEILSITLVRDYPFWQTWQVETPSWHPPLHYAIPKLLDVFGARSEFSLRIGGALSGIALVAVSFLVPLLFGAPQLALIAGLLTATSPMAVLFSQTNRWHPYVAALLGISILCMLVGVRWGRHWGWVCAGLLMALAVSTVYVAAVPVGALLLLGFAAALRKRELLRGWYFMAITAVVLALPAVICGPQWFRPTAVGGQHLDNVFSSAGTLGLIAQNLLVGPTVFPWNWPIMGLACAALVCVAWFCFRSNDPVVRSIRTPALLFIVLCMPIIVIVPMTASSRYWLVMLVPLHVGMAAGLVSMRRKWLQVACAGAIAIVAIYGLVNLYMQREYQYIELCEPWGRLAAFVRNQVGPDDAVWSLTSPFVYYYGDGAEYVMNAYQDPAKVNEYLIKKRPHRVFLQYSPLSGWGEIDVEKIAADIGGVLRSHGFIRESRAFYEKDPNAMMKRKYVRGRSFPDFRHALEVWERE